MLIKVISLKNWRSILSKVFWWIQWSDTTLQYSPFAVLCDLVLCWRVLYTPDLTPPGMTGYALDSTTGAWPHQESLLSLGTCSHTYVFPSVRVVLSVTFIPGFVVIMDKRYLINGWHKRSYSSHGALQAGHRLNGVSYSWSLVVILSNVWNCSAVGPWSG